MDEKPTLKDAAFNTRAVHAGERAAPPQFTPVVTPVQPAVGYVYATLAQADAVLGGEEQGFIYSRYTNPTSAAFEQALANLEGASHALSCASGMAALHLALLASGAQAGAHVICALDVYGATFSLLRSLLHSLGVSVQFVDVTRLDEVEQALQAQPAAALLVETISNPLLKLADLAALAQLAHAHGAQLLVDNTFATPYLCNPLALGADLVIHSATKYLGGHGDVLAGVIATDAAHYARLYELNKLVGAALGPFEAYLALRGIKTLPLRLRQQCENAQRVAQWLAEQPQIERVHYPGLAGHPQQQLGQRLFQGRGFGGVLSFEIRAAGRDEVFRFFDALKLCLPATSLGDIYSLVLYPPISSHRSLSSEERRRIGIPDNLVRLSLGIEAAEDIIADLQQALEKR